MEREVVGKEMKMTFRKSFDFIIDTSSERKRINKNFKDMPQTKKKLLKLMDLVEQEKWKEAEKELRGAWWQGHDAKYECPRLEFVGTLDSSGLDNWATYIDLILRMSNYPDVYKLLEKK